MPNYSQSGMDEIHAEPWLDFHLYQSGTICDLPRVTNRARELSPQLEALTVWPNHKVTVNGESVYDEGDAVTPTNRNNRFRARQTAWLSSLTGAFGFSAGIGGVWDWGVCGLATPNICNERFPDGWRTYSQGMAQPASGDMVAFRAIRRRVFTTALFNEQWRLALNVTLPDTKKQAFLRDSWNILAYLPEGPSIDIVASGLTGDVNLRKWYDPSDGTIDTDPAGVFCGAGVCSFSNPATGAVLGAGDRVLLQPARTVSSLSWSGSSGKFVQAFEGRYEVEETWGIWGDLRNEDASLVSGPVRISDASVSEARNPAVARDGNGGFLVAWEADGNLDGAPEIRGRRLDPNGVPIAAEFEISSEKQGSSHHPSVALDAIGNAIVVWESLDETTGLKQIWIQRLDWADRPAGDPEGIGELENTWPGPRIAADAAGNALLVWAEADESGSNQLVSLFLGESGQLTNQVVASSLSNDSLALSGVVASANGTFVVEWEVVNPDGSTGRWARNYSAQGEALGGEYSVTSSLTGGQAE